MEFPVLVDEPVNFGVRRLIVACHHALIVDRCGIGERRARNGQSTENTVLILEPVPFCVVDRIYTHSYACVVDGVRLCSLCPGVVERGKGTLSVEKTVVGGQQAAAVGADWRFRVAISAHDLAEIIDPIGGRGVCFRIVDRRIDSMIPTCSRAAPVGNSRPAAARRSPHEDTLLVNSRGEGAATADTPRRVDCQEGRGCLACRCLSVGAFSRIRQIVSNDLSEVVCQGVCDERAGKIAGRGKSYILPCLRQPGSQGKGPPPEILQVGVSRLAPRSAHQCHDTTIPVHAPTETHFEAVPSSCPATYTCPFTTDGEDGDCSRDLQDGLHGGSCQERPACPRPTSVG